jgi:uncharacterized protein (DUF2336 family)
MGVPASLLPELDKVVRRGTAEKRAATLRQITTLFLEGSARFNDEHVALFDDVIGRLMEGCDNDALGELARRIAWVANAPLGVLRKLADNDDIAVAEPVLRESQLEDSDLLRIAQTKGQAHLLALAKRRQIGEALANVLAARGDENVLRALADKGELAKPPRRDSAAAMAAMRARHKEHKLGEADIAGFAKAGRYEEMIAALALVCSVPVEVVDRLMHGERPDPVLILARAAGFTWPTLREIINARPGGKLSSEAMDAASENFERLTAATAQRVVRFWQVRNGTAE